MVLNTQNAIEAWYYVYFYLFVKSIHNIFIIMMCLHKHGYFLQSGPELHGPTGSQMDRIELFKAYIHTEVSEDITQLTIV